MEGRIGIVVFYITSRPNSGSLRMPTMTSRLRGLRFHEALEVERIAHGATPSIVFETGLSVGPDSS